MQALGRWATPQRCYPGKPGASSVKDAQLGALAHTRCRERWEPAFPDLICFWGQVWYVLQY